MYTQSFHGETIYEYMPAQIIPDDGIHLDHGYLDTLDNPLGPP